MVSDIATLAKSWRVSLRAANRAETTVRIYLFSLGLLEDFLKREHAGMVAKEITRLVLDGFLADLLTHMSPSSAAVHFRSIRVFFAWLVDMDEIDRSPMAKMKPPKVPPKPPRIPTDDEVRALLCACKGKGFMDRRDLAIVSLLADTGIRLAECAGITLADLDLDASIVTVLGKGSKLRSVHIGSLAATNMDAYLRVRRKHPAASRGDLWLGSRGVLLSNGIHETLKKRASEAGMPWFHCHLLRSYFAHTWLSRGGSQVELMSACGWTQPTMVARYTASTATERTHKAHARIGLLDHLK